MRDSPRYFSRCPTRFHAPRPRGGSGERGAAKPGMPGSATPFPGTAQGAGGDSKPSFMIMSASILKPNAAAGVLPWAFSATTVQV